MSNLSPAAVLYDSSGNEKGVSTNPVSVDGVVTSTLVETDSFGTAVVGSRYNQLEVAFDQVDPDAITTITVTKSNGGDAANSAGQAVFTTGTATNGGIKVVTNTNVSYRPQAEVYAAFTCIFTAGAADSYQRIGIYDANDGFFIGYEGTAFGLTIRKGGVDTRTARASFSLDPLTGGASSKYTRNGTPETMDPTKDQLYRIRFGWLGAAPITFEILSPDGKWVPFHVYKHPNTVAATTINNPDLPITLDAQKTAGATNITMNTACWAAGTTSDLAPVTSTVTANSLASLTRAVITGQTTAGGGGFVNVKVNPSGALAVAADLTSYGGTAVGAGNALHVQPGTGAVFPVSDNGGSLTVDGTVTANQGGTWNINNVSGTVSLPTGASTAANQTTLGSQTTKINDGTNTAAVKAASTAAQASDTSLVVGLSPNSPLPTGTNSIGTVTAVQATAANLNALSAQGAAAALSGKWPVQHTDGTNTLPTADVAGRALFSKVTDGTNTAAVKAASTPAALSDPALVVQISPNQDPIPTSIVPTNAFSGNSQGRTPSTTTGTFVSIRQTTYTEQTTNGQRSFTSSSANDSSAGTGARQVRIEYLDQNGNGPSLLEPFYTETVTLNGTTAVNTVATNICFIEHMEVVSVGSGGANAGTITLFTGTGGTGTAIGTIATGNITTGVGDNESLWAHHYVPNLFETAIYTITGGCTAAAGGGSYVQVLKGKHAVNATAAEVLVGDIITIAQGNAFLRSFGAPLLFTGPYRLVLYGTPGSNNTTMYGSFDYSDRPA